jgi:hypothetical protein
MDSTQIPHDYYPPWISLPHYTPNESSVISLITQFGLQWGFVLVASFLLIGRLRPTASTSDRVAFTWMCLSMYTFKPDLTSYTIFPFPSLQASHKSTHSKHINSGIHPPLLRSPLRHQPQNPSRRPIPLFPAMEGMLAFRFAVFDI